MVSPANGVGPFQGFTLILTRAIFRLMPHVLLLPFNRSTIHTRPTWPVTTHPGPEPLLLVSQVHCCRADTMILPHQHNLAAFQQTWH